MTSFFRGGRYEVRKGTMLDLIRVAYGVDSYKVLGGPGWLETDRFDVIARTPVDTTPEALKEMLKALLVDRFKLVVRNDNMPIPTFVLTAGKGKRNMNEADKSSGPGGCQPMPASPPKPGETL
jgi:uncharacterized protein (TIGR03435 family)